MIDGKGVQPDCKCGCARDIQSNDKIYYSLVGVVNGHVQGLVSLTNRHQQRLSPRRFDRESGYGPTFGICQSNQATIYMFVALFNLRAPTVYGMRNSDNFFYYMISLDPK